MATIDFPSSPVPDQEYVYGDFTYVYDGEKWTTKVITGSGSGDGGNEDYVPIDGSLPMTGPLYAPEFYVTSDIRLKSEFVTIDNSLLKVLTLTGKIYTKDGKREAGIIAQDLQQILPEAVCEDSNGMLSVSPSGVNAILVEAIKELILQVKELQDKVKILEKSNTV